MGDLFSQYAFILRIIQYQLIMGAEMCCTLQETSNKFRGDLYRLDAFELVQSLSNDPIIRKWMQENQTTKDADSGEGKQKQFLKLKAGDIYYYCDWVNSLAEGKGFAYKPNVLFFDGFFHKGVPGGQAVVQFLNQSCLYKGQVEGWRAHGNGQLHNNKAQYLIKGCWENSKLKNASIEFEKDANISKITIEDFDHKKAHIQYKDGRWYEGQISLRKLEPHGTGKINFTITSFKNYYEGQWYKGQICGKGKLVYKNKSFYEGQFFNGQKEGFGRFTYEDGKYFEGYWHKGKQLGVGAIYSIIGDAIKYGQWENGKFKQELTRQKWQQKSQIEKSRQTKLLQDESIIQQKEQQLSIKPTQSKYY